MSTFCTAGSDPRYISPLEMYRGSDPPLLPGLLVEVFGSAVVRIGSALAQEFRLQHGQLDFTGNGVGVDDYRTQQALQGIQQSLNGTARQAATGAEAVEQQFGNLANGSSTHEVHVFLGFERHYTDFVAGAKGFAHGHQFVVRVVAGDEAGEHVIYQQGLSVPDYANAHIGHAQSANQVSVYLEVTQPRDTRQYFALAGWYIVYGLALLSASQGPDVHVE